MSSDFIKDALISPEDNVFLRGVLSVEEMIKDINKAMLRMKNTPGLFYFYHPDR